MYNIHIHTLTIVLSSSIIVVRFESSSILHSCHSIDQPPHLGRHVIDHLHSPCLQSFAHTTHAVVLSLIVSVRHADGHSHTTYSDRHVIGRPHHYSQVVTSPVVHVIRVINWSCIHSTSHISGHQITTYSVHHTILDCILNQFQRDGIYQVGNISRIY